MALSEEEAARRHATASKLVAMFGNAVLLMLGVLVVIVIGAALLTRPSSSSNYQPPATRSFIELMDRADLYYDEVDRENEKFDRCADIANGDDYLWARCMESG